MGLTVLLPAYNEAGTIGGVIREFYDEVVRPVSGELLVCEDGSTDGTREVLRALQTTLPIRIHTGTSRLGYGEAVRQGLLQILSPLTMFADSDGQYDPRDFWQLWSHVGDFDMVIGRKIRRQEPFHRTLLSRGFHILIKALTSVPLRDMDCGFRIVRRRVVEEVLPDIRSLEYSFWAEFSILAYRKGFRILEVPVSHRARLQGTSSIYGWDRLPRIIWVQMRGLTRLARRLREPTRETSPNRKPPSVLGRSETV